MQIVDLLDGHRYNGVRGEYMARERILTRDIMLERTGELLPKVGYEGFTFSLLAEHLNVSRGAIYKYYANRDALLMDYMLFHMERFNKDLEQMDDQVDFHSKFDTLIQLLYKHSEIHQILKTADQIPINERAKTEEGMQRFHQLFHTMKKQMEEFISFGKRENYIRQEIPNEVILLFLHQLVEIPSLEKISRDNWIKYVTEILQRGIFINS